LPETAGDITRLLIEWRNGDPAALEKLTPLLYADLRGLARRFMRRERPNHTLEPTALIHEAYLRLADQSSPAWQDRSHFFAVASKIMRQVLVDQARRRHRAKRDGGRRVTLEETVALPGNRSADLLDLDFALGELAKLDPLKAQMVELRFFGGLTVDETAAALDTSTRTVYREMRMAETWLYQRLKAEPV
jgi:RNA polymerase sigma factor (TIGR02999 family)